MARSNATVILPHATDPHPDLLGLSALLMAGEYAGDMVLGWGVSQQFSESARHYRKEKFSLGPIDPALVPRSRPENRTPGLCFSGGVDSFAALELLPPNTESFFLSRIHPNDDPRPHRKSSASGKRATSYLRSIGRIAFDIDTDLEHLRDPIGFPDHLAVAVPLLLMADDRKISSASFGTVAEAAYRTGSTEFRDIHDRLDFTRLYKPFDAVGVPIHNVVAGLSEVVTTKIVVRSKHWGRDQSCMYGGERPCEECIKCVRKQLVAAAVTEKWPRPKALTKLFIAFSARKKLGALPIKLENIFGYVAWRYRGRHPIMRELRHRTRANELSFAWMEKYIPSSLDYMPEDLREYFLGRISNYADPLTSQDMKDVRKWSVIGINRDEEMIRRQKRLRFVMRQAVESASQSRFDRILSYLAARHR